jgi:uncharacterized protein (TIRG00374 family)
MVIGLFVFLLYLYSFVGFNDILEILQKVNPYEYYFSYSLTIAAIVLSILFYSKTWHELLKSLSVNIGLKKTFIYCWLGNFVDLVLPLETVTGEITRLYLAHNLLKANFGKIVASLVSHRIISIFTTLVGLILSSLYFLYTNTVEPYIVYIILFMTIGTAVTIVILIYLLVKEEAAERIVNALIGFLGIIIRNPEKLNELRKKNKRTLSVVYQAVKTYMKNPIFLVKPLLYSFISWLFHLVIYLLVFYALGFLDVTSYITQMIIVLSITLSVQGMPVGLPVGPTEIVMSSLFVMFFGVEMLDISGTATLLIRVITFWFQILVGYILSQWIGIKNLLDTKHKPSVST